MHRAVVIVLALARTTREYYALAALCLTWNRDAATTAIYNDPHVRRACRFGSEQQARDAVNRAVRSAVRVRFGGHTRALGEWEKTAGVLATVLWDRLERGIPVGKALGYYKEGPKPKAKKHACERPAKVTGPGGNTRCT